MFYKCKICDQNLIYLYLFFSYEIMTIYSTFKMMTFSLDSIGELAFNLELITSKLFLVSLER